MGLTPRRTVLECVGAGVISSLAGCIDISTNIGENGDPDPKLRVYPNIEQTENSWEMPVRVRNVYDWDTSFHDVTVIAFDEYGEEVCRVSMGDFPQNGRFEESKSVDCTNFPAIVTATAEETPCDGAKIRMVYYTSEKDPTSVEDLSYHGLWDGRWRECNEALPPERVIQEVSWSGSTEKEDSTPDGN